MKRAALILFATLAVPSAASASPVTFSADYIGLGNAQVVTVMKGATTKTVWAGEIRWDGDAGAPTQFDKFFTYCVDLTTALVDPQTFDVKTTSSLQPSGNQIAWLVTAKAAFIGAMSGSTANAMAAGLQLAIWNVLYDTDFTVDGGTFSSSTASAAYYANQYLGDLNTAVTNGLTANASAVFLDTGRGQDQVTTSVSEPATLLMFGLGAAVVAARRRRMA